MQDSETVIAAKRQLRSAAIERRAKLAAPLRADGSTRLSTHGLEFLGARAPSTISAFLAIGEEIDPAALLERLVSEGFGLALPVMVGKGQPLAFRRWRPGDPLRTRMWGIREPEAHAATVDPDILLVPLLAFDRTGLRLGYGGGFYDRTLRSLRRVKPIVAVGLAFSAQEVDAVPHLDYDERLDWVLTPEGPIRCSAPTGNAT